MSIPRSLRGGVRSHRVLGFRSRFHCVMLPLGFRSHRVIGFDPTLGCRTLALSKASVSSLWQRVRNRVSPTVSNPVPRARAAFWITDGKLPVIQITAPRVKGCGADGGGVDPRVRSQWFRSPLRLQYFAPVGFEPDSWVSIPRVRTRLQGFRSLGFEPDSWGFDPVGVRTRLLGFDP